MHEGRAARRLALAAQALEPVKPPYYVRLPVLPGLERAFPAAGWYWVPHDHPVAVYLGASFEVAYAELRDLVREQINGSG